MAEAHHEMKLQMTLSEPFDSSYTEPPLIQDNYSLLSNETVDPAPSNFPRFPQHEFPNSIVSLLRQDQFLDAAKEFERWCLDCQCNSSSYSSLLSLVSTANDMLETLIKSGHSLRDFIEANKKEEDYRILLLKEKCKFSSYLILLLFYISFVFHNLCKCLIKFVCCLWVQIFLPP